MDHKQKSETLMNILDKCLDNTTAEEKQKIFTNHPFAREIIEKTIVPENLTIAELEAAICTAVYVHSQQLVENLSV